MDGYRREVCYLHAKYPQIMPREEDLKKWEEEPINHRSLSEDQVRALRAFYRYTMPRDIKTGEIIKK